MKIRNLFLTLIFLLPILQAQAEPIATPASVYLEDLTWPEIGSRIRMGTKTAIIICAGNIANATIKPLAQ